MTNPKRRPTGDGPGLERTVTLTDAVVAIAMTLLVLPLVETSGDVDAHRLGEYVSSYGYLLLSFGISFLVIHAFWAAHGSALSRLTVAETEAPALRSLNMWWLLVIAFLPFPTAVVGRDLTTTSGPFYIGTMLVLSLLTSAIAVVADRAVDRAGARDLVGPARGLWTWVTPAVFAVCAVLAAFDASLGLWSLLALVVVRVLEVRALGPAAPV